MKVVHVNSDYGNTIYKNLSDSLFKLGIEQRVYKFIRPNIMPNLDDYDDYVDVRLNYGNLDRYFYHIKHNKVAHDFINYCIFHEVDLIHAHTLFSNGYVAYQAYKRLHIPYIVTVRSTDIQIFFKYMRHLRKVGREILLNASKVIFISHAHKKAVFNKYIPDKYRDYIENKTLVIPNGIDQYYFKNKSLPKVLNKNKKITIMTSAWINKNKNQLNVCKAIQELIDRGYEIKYRIIGGVEKPNTYLKLVNKLKSYSFVELIPRKSKTDLIKEYRNADIFVMVSYRETFGLSYIESLLQSTPIVYTKNQGIDGYFQDGYVGYAALPKSPVDIANKIEMVIGNYETLSKNALLSTENFEWKNISLKYKEIYNSTKRR